MVELRRALDERDRNDSRRLVLLLEELLLDEECAPLAKEDVTDVDLLRLVSLLPPPANLLLLSTDVLLLRLPREDVTRSTLTERDRLSLPLVAAPPLSPPPLSLPLPPLRANRPGFTTLTPGRCRLPTTATCGRLPHL